MPRGRTRSTGPRSWQFNMTPLIDVTFLLLTYFMLASHYASAERPDMAVPRPVDSLAQDRPLQDKIIINLLCGGSADVPDLMYGPIRLESLAQLKQRLEVAGRSTPQPQVILRADRNVRYGYVREVMEAIAAARLANLQVIAELPTVK